LGELTGKFLLRNSRFILLQRSWNTSLIGVKESMRIACTGPRILRPELLDLDPPPGVVEATLKDLVRINQWFGGHQVLRTLLREQVEHGERFSFLDVGAASGDMGRAVRKWYPDAHVISLDRKALHLKSAPKPRLAADAFQLPFSPGSVDIVFCSLFLHHFNSRQAVELLCGFKAVAKRALLVIDLERHPLAYYFIPSTKWLLNWSELVVQDGMISVEAAWKPSELKRLAVEAGLSGARVRRHMPWFRLSLSAAL
jgi:SAM-dependent methyltransferase